MSRILTDKEVPRPAQGEGFGLTLSSGTRRKGRRHVAHIAEGTLPTELLIVGRIRLDGVAQAFQDLGSPDHTTILVAPGR